jgi:hypothetical protein
VFFVVFEVLSLLFFSRIGIRADVVFKVLSCRFCLQVVGLHCLCDSYFFIFCFFLWMHPDERCSCAAIVVF